MTQVLPNPSLLSTTNPPSSSSNRQSSSKLLRFERCPECASRGLDTSGDNLGVYDDGHSYCFSCEYYHSPTSKASATQLGFSYQYCPWRGISSSTFESFGCQTKCDEGGQPISVGFRYPNGDIKVRLIDKKEFYWITKSPEKHGLFGRDRFAAGSSKTLIITEGEMDAISFWQALKVPAVSVSSSNSAVTDCTVDRSWCNSFEKIYLGFDGDVAGLDAKHPVANLFELRNVYNVKI